MKIILTYTTIFLSLALMAVGCVEEVKEVEKPNYLQLHTQCILDAHAINEAEIAHLHSTLVRQFETFGTKNTVYADSRRQTDSFENAYKAKHKICDSLSKLY